MANGPELSRPSRAAREKTAICMRFKDVVTCLHRLGARVLALSLCVGTGAGLAASGAHADTLVVIAGPATGRHAHLFSAMRAGAQDAVRAGAPLATKDITVQAGDAPPAALAGAGLVFRDADDGCDAVRARGAATEIISQSPALVIGHPCPAAAIAAAPVYAAAGIPFIALGVRHPALTDQRAGNMIFRLSGRDDRQGEAAAAALKDAAPEGRIAIVQDRTAYARSVLAETTAALEARGLKADPILPIVAGRRDYAAVIDQIAAARSEAVLFAGYPSEAVVLLRGLRTAGISVRLIGSDATATPDFAEAVIASGSGPRNVMVLARAPLQGAAAGIGKEDELSVLAAAAIEAWWAAVLQAGSPEPARVISVLGTEELPTRALGPISFDAQGDARLPSFRAAPLMAGRWNPGTP